MATYLLRPSSEEGADGPPAEVELAKRGGDAVDWLTLAVRLGESAMRQGAGNAYGGGKVKVSWS